MSHELILEPQDNWPVLPGWGRVRDPLRYAVTVFGHPGPDDWGWRFAGHHLSLHYTVATADESFTASASVGGPAGDLRLMPDPRRRRSAAKIPALSPPPTGGSTSPRVRIVRIRFTPSVPSTEKDPCGEEI